MGPVTAVALTARLAMSNLSDRFQFREGRLWRDFCTTLRKHSGTTAQTFGTYVLNRYLVSPVYNSSLSKALSASLMIVSRISSLRGVMLHLNGFGRMFRPFLHNT